MATIDFTIALSCSACDFAELTRDPQRLDAALVEHEVTDGHRLTASVPPEADSADMRNLVINGMLDLLRVLNRPAPWIGACTCGWTSEEWPTEAEAREATYWHGTTCVAPRVMDVA